MLNSELNAKPRRVYFPELDGLRTFFAFLLVLIHHTPLHPSTFGGETPLYLALDSLRNFGWMGVDLFLVLSSYLIAVLLLKELGQFQRISFGRFYSRRVLRIWPLYLPFLWIMVLLAGYLTGDPLFKGAGRFIIKMHGLPFTFFLGNFSYAYSREGLSGLFDHLWTICLEEQFYLIVPFLILVCAKLPKTMVFGLLGLVGASVWARHYYIANAIPFPWLWVTPPTRIDPFGLGILAALVRHQWPRAFHHVGRLWVFALGIACLVGVVVTPTVDDTRWVWQLFGTAFGSLLITISVGENEWLKRFFSFPFLVKIGKLSFGLYVFHNALIFAFRRFQLGAYFPLGFSGWLATLLALFATSWVCAYLSYHFYEVHFLRLKKRFEVVPSRPE